MNWKNDKWKRLIKEMWVQDVIRMMVQRRGLDVALTNMEQSYITSNLFRKLRGTNDTND